MKSILFIMLEIDSASGICVSNVADQMIQNGWKVDILSYHTNRKINQKINKYDIRPEFFRYMYQKYNGNVLLSKFFSICYKIKVAITTFMWPWNSPVFTLRLLKKTYQLYNAQIYDCIVPVYTQIDPIIVAHLLKRKYNEAKIVPYFLDSLSAGPAPKLLSKKNKIKKGLKWEKKLLINADGVIFMQSSKNHHMKYSAQRDYFKNVVFLDIPALCINSNYINNQEDQKKNSDCISITYVGSLPNGIRNPEYAFKTLSHMKDLKIHINMIGVSEEEAKAFNTFNLDISWLGRVSHDEAIKYIISSDILLNLGNRIEGMVPSKIFEYMTYAKPILSFSPMDNEPSLAYLKKYPKSCTLMEYNSVEKNVRLAWAFIKNINNVAISLDNIKSQFYKNTPNCFCDYINRLLGNNL